MGIQITIAQATYLENEKKISGVSDDLLTIHGIAPGSKTEGVTQLVYKNPEDFNARLRDNDKSNKAKEVIYKVGADIVAYSEHKINCRHKDNSNGMGQMFNGGEAEIII